MQSNPTDSPSITAFKLFKGPLTDSSFANLILRYGKDRNQLDHDLRHNIRHKRGQGDLGINMETIEEVLEAFKEFEEDVITSAYTISSLKCHPNIRLTQQEKEVAHGKESIDPDQDELCRLERYLRKRVKMNQ